jgi:hypothetical protein
VVYGNTSNVLANGTVGPDQNSVWLFNLTAGQSYEFQVAAMTRAGFGPMSRPLAVSRNPSPFRDPHSLYRDNNDDDGDGVDGAAATANAGPLYQQTWFIVLVSLICFTCLGAFVAFVCFRRRSIMTRKDGGILGGELQRVFRNFFVQSSARISVLLVHTLSLENTENSVLFLFVNDVRSSNRI